MAPGVREVEGVMADHHIPSSSDVKGVTDNMAEHNTPLNPDVGIMAESDMWHGPDVKEVVESMSQHNLPSARYQPPYCSDKDDIPKM